MKKFLSAIFILCLISTFSACTNEVQTEIPENPDTEFIENVPETSEPEVFENPDTSVMYPYDENIETSDEPSSEKYNYLAEAEKAEALEKYLRENLSEEDHGGIFLQKLDVVTLSIWYVNEENIKEIISEYPGEPFEVIFLEANCSYKKLHNFAEELLTLNVPENEIFLPYISEEDNWIAVNISENAYEILKDDIFSLAEKHSMERNDWKLVILDPAGDGINT